MWDSVESKPPIILAIGLRSDEAQLLNDVINDLSLKVRLTSIPSYQTARQMLLNKGPYADVPKPDLIVVFCDRSDSGTVEMVWEVRQLSDHSITPLVVFSTSQNAAKIQDAYRLGANCVICKPASVLDLAEAFKSTLLFWLKAAELPAS